MLAQLKSHLPHDTKYKTFLYSPREGGLQESENAAGQQQAREYDTQICWPAHQIIDVLPLQDEDLADASEQTRQEANGMSASPRKSAQEHDQSDQDELLDVTKEEGETSRPMDLDTKTVNKYVLFLCIVKPRSIRLRRLKA